MQIRKSNFLGNSIQNLQTAIFSNDSKAILKLPTSIIKLQEIDQGGDLVFAVSKPHQNVSDLDQRFPGELQFYKKGTRYFVKVCGVASIIQNDNSVETSQILVKFHKERLEFHRLRAESKGGGRVLVKNYINSLLSFLP